MICWKKTISKLIYDAVLMQIIFCVFLTKQIIFQLICKIQLRKTSRRPPILCKTMLFSYFLNFQVKIILCHKQTLHMSNIFLFVYTFLSSYMYSYNIIIPLFQLIGCYCYQISQITERCRNIILIIEQQIVTLGGPIGQNTFSLSRMVSFIVLLSLIIYRIFKIFYFHEISKIIILICLKNDDNNVSKV